MSYPPLDAPPFQPATLRNCIRASVRIQNIDQPQEVLILTSVNRSIDSILSVDPDTQINGYRDDGGGGEELCDSDFSSFSETSSSEEETEDEMEGEQGSQDSPNNNDGGGKIRAQCTEVPNQGFPMKAFWLNKERPLCENHHGVYKTFIYYAKVLQKADIYWIGTDEEVAIKVVSWRCIRACQNRLSEDFIKEIAALQYLSEWHETEMAGRTVMDTHILNADTIMSNESDLYIVMPYCAGGDLCQRVAEKEELRFTEDESRFWFKQILTGLETLQLMQICHRDLSPENMIILEQRTLVIDFGMCLRIPYSPSGMHLITPQNPCGKLPHMSPELIRRLPFDGHAVDVWAAGTILLFMLTGRRLNNPPLIDRAFDGVELGVSYEAMDLLRKMFRLDPNNRLSLEQIKNHNWVQYESLPQL